MLAPVVISLIVANTMAASAAISAAWCSILRFNKLREALKVLSSIKLAPQRRPVGSVTLRNRTLISPARMRASNRSLVGTTVERVFMLSPAF